MQNETQFKVTWGLNFFGKLICENPGIWKWTGDLESRFLADDLAQKSIIRPIYICGLARSGSTILLELLSKHPDIATHRYSDFPPIYTPITFSHASHQACI